MSSPRTVESPDRVTPPGRRRIRGSLRLRVVVAFALGSLLISATIAVATFAICERYLVAQRERSLLRQAWADARIMRQGLATPDRAAAGRGLRAGPGQQGARARGRLVVRDERGRRPVRHSRRPAPSRGKGHQRPPADPVPRHAGLRRRCPAAGRVGRVLRGRVDRGPGPDAAHDLGRARGGRCARDGSRRAPRVVGRPSRRAPADRDRSRRRAGGGGRPRRPARPVRRPRPRPAVRLVQPHGRRGAAPAPSARPASPRT